MTLADFIKRRRADRAMSLRAVAAAAGTSSSGVLALENGTTIDPHVSVLLGMAKALQVRPTLLFAAAVESQEGPPRAG